MPPTNERPPIPATDPALVRFVEKLTDTGTKQADGIADMLLIFLSAGGTILGSILAGGLYEYFRYTSDHDFAWITFLLITVAFGGVVGCLSVMGILHARNMIVWENKEHARG